MHTNTRTRTRTRTRTNTQTLITCQRMGRGCKAARQFVCSRSCARVRASSWVRACAAEEAKQHTHTHRKLKTNTHSSSAHLAIAARHHPSSRSRRPQCLHTLHRGCTRGGRSKHVSSPELGESRRGEFGKSLTRTSTGMHKHQYTRDWPAPRQHWPLVHAHTHARTHARTHAHTYTHMHTYTPCNRPHKHTQTQHTHNTQ